MAQLNLLNLGYRPLTHEGAPARNLAPELQLRRSVLACLLWEAQFYEDGVEIAGRIAELGTHEELIARNGYYTSLFEKQRLEEELAVAT